MTERLHFHFSLSCIGEGNGNPLQCSCLENPRDGGAWWAAVYGVAPSWTRLKQLSSIVVAKSEIQRCGGKKWVWLQQGNMRASVRLKVFKHLAREGDTWTRWWTFSAHMHKQVHMSTSKIAEIWIRLLECNMEKEMATHSSIPAWRSPGTEEPGVLPSMGLHSVRHDWSDLAAADCINVNILLVNSKTVAQNILLNETWKSIQGIFLHYFLQLYVNL